jgi:hypothetical protein
MDHPRRFPSPGFQFRVLWVILSFVRELKERKDGGGDAFLVGHRTKR